MLGHWQALGSKLQTLKLCPNSDLDKRIGPSVCNALSLSLSVEWRKKLQPLGAVVIEKLTERNTYGVLYLNMFNTTLINNIDKSKEVYNLYNTLD